MGSGIGGSDGRDFSVFTMRTLREHFDTTWKYFIDKILYPTIDSIEFVNLKRNALVGLTGGRTNPDQYARLIADSVYFLGHPYGIRLTREAVERTDRESILSHFKRSMVRARMLLVVVGNISRTELEKKLERSGIETLPMGEYSEPVIPIPPRSQTPSAVFPPYDRKLPTKYVRGYFRIPSPGHPDYYPYLRLSRFFGGFLFQHLRVQTNLSYAPDLNEVESREAYGIISFETSLVDSAVRMVHRDIDFFQKNTLLESAIRGGVNRYTTSTLMKQESTVEIASALGRAQIMTGSWRNAFFNYDRLATVKPEDIQRVANTYLRNITWVVIGDTRDVSKDLLESR
jgi:zinc protease